MSAETRNRTLQLTVGTAGHIDHGKTELVKYLTGCNTDRLPEEQRRHMTIDLGFATCNLPGDRRVGIVDVPGHERFVHNMVAGATGIDMVLLVVAADDGVMPQTVEHFHIVSTLGIRSGMIVITKTDLVDPRRVQSVAEDICDLVAGSFLEGAPVAPFSAKTGEGFDMFYEKFAATVDRTAERGGEGAFCLHIERAFNLKGVGTVISGVPCSGCVRVGDELELLPEGGMKRVKGIQVYGRDSAEGQAGECVALRLGNVSREDVGRGMVVAEPGFFSPSIFVNARFRLLPSAGRPMKPRTPVRFHLGTSDVSGHIVLPGLDPLPPGAESYVQFQLNQPVVATPRDFFVVRSLGPVTTMGGGYVVSSADIKIRRSRGDWADECREREEAFRRPDTAVAYVLRRIERKPVSFRQLAHKSFVTEDAVGRHVEKLCRDGVAVMLGNAKAASREAVETVRAGIMAQLNAMHDENPAYVGFPKRDLLARVSFDRILADRAMEELLSEKLVLSNLSGLSVAGREPSFSPAQRSLMDNMTARYLEGGFMPPNEDDLPGLLGAPAQLLRPLVEHLVQRGTLARLDDNVLLHADSLETARTLLVDYLEEHGSIESGTFRDMLKTSRKFSIPILEYWDRHGLTRRIGNERVLKKQKN